MEYLESGGSVLVQFVDYGNLKMLPVTALRELHARHLNLPLQALECRLYGVVPNTRRGDGWSQEAVNIFRDFYCNRQAVFMDVRALEGQIMEVRETSSFLGKNRFTANVFSG